MSFMESSGRRQTLLLPECLDDYVETGSPVRFLDGFVNGLDLRACGFHFPKEDELGRGRPAYHPGTLLKLYIYGYLHGIRSGVNAVL